MIQQNHTIKKLSVELQMASQQNSYAMQRRCIKVIKEDVLQQIDNLLSAQFSTNETVFIKRIEINLGTINASALETEFVQKYITAFNTTIQQIKTNTQPASAQINSKDADTTAINQLFYFLTTGKMPWETFNINFTTWQHAVSIALQKNINQFKTGFTQLIASNENAAERLIYQFDDNFLKNIFSVYAPHLTNNILGLDVLLNNKMASNDVAAIRLLFYKSILFFISGASNKRAAHYLPGVQAIFNKLPVALISTDAIQKIIANYLAVFKTCENDSKPIKTADGITHILPQNKQEISKESCRDKSDDNASYIANAGIVLLHPYLKTFFTAVGLLHNDDFKDDYCKQKAVHLLQYLATGQQHLPEYMLILNKLLCAMPDEAHIDRFIELTAEELAMVNELLQAVITNWAVLGNTSVGALQETFLQRQAKLFFNNTTAHWQLQVQRNGIDVLLDKIPWGFAYIKLPWMQQPLATEW